MIRLTRRESGAAGNSLAVVFSMPMGRSRPRSGYASLWERKAKPTFVLVHGAFHGAWCWERLTRYMLGAGYTCYCISLTGLGLMSNLAHPGIDLESHIEDVMTVIDSEDLKDVVLVGHAYGGMVIAGVADRMSSRIRRAVYLDAFVPDRGKCVLDYIQPAEKAAQMRKRGEVSGMIDPPSVYEWGLTRPADVRWADALFEQAAVPHADPADCTEDGRGKSAGAEDVHLLHCAGYEDVQPVRGPAALRPVMAASRFQGLP